MSRPIELGTGQVNSDVNKPIVHFGSPEGTTFRKGDAIQIAEDPRYGLRADS